jgi:hypothetical protein
VRRLVLKANACFVGDVHKLAWSRVIRRSRRGRLVLRDRCGNTQEQNCRCYV